MNSKRASWRSLRLGVGYVFLLIRSLSTPDNVHDLQQHCKNLAPEYEKVAKSFNNLVPLYAMDCDAEANKALCGQQVSESRRSLRY